MILAGGSREIPGLEPLKSKVGSCRKGEVVELVIGSSKCPGPVLGYSDVKCLSSSQGIA